MKFVSTNKQFSVVMALLFALALLLAGTVWAQAADGGPGTAAPQAAVGSTFTYQGRLDKNGNGVTSTCDFQFKLYDAASGGSQVGSTQTKSGVSVTDGLFTTELDFGSNAFDGDARYLEIAVKCSGDGSYTTLNGRTALNAVPYALNLRPGAIVRGSDTSGSILGAVNSDTTGTGAGLYGEANAANAAGVSGWNVASSSGYAVYGNNAAGSGTPYGVYGIASDSGGVTSYGVYGKSNSSVGTGVGGSAPTNGVYGEASNTTGTTWGVYGKSNSPDGYGLYSNGNAHVDGQLTWKAVTSYVSIPAAAFHPAVNGYIYSNDGKELTPGDGSSTFYLSEVQLPHGATITNFTFFWTDSATPDGFASFYQVNMDGTETQLGGDADTYGGGPGGGVTASSSPGSFSPVQVDNSLYSYYFYVALPMDSDGPVSLHGITVEYTIERPY